MSVLTHRNAADQPVVFLVLVRQYLRLLNNLVPTYLHHMRLTEALISPALGTELGSGRWVYDIIVFFRSCTLLTEGQWVELTQIETEVAKAAATTTSKSL